MLADTYNQLIDAFGDNFDQFNSKEAARVCKSLARAGLKQEDVFDACIKKIEDEAEKFRALYSFSSVFLPIFRGIADLNMQKEDFFNRLTSDEFISKTFYGGKSFKEHVQALNRSMQEEILYSILVTGLDK